MKNEPVAIIGAVGAALAAVIGVAVAFGLPITEDQQTAILAAVGPVGIVVVLIITRRLVTPNGRVVEREDGGKVVAGEGSELPNGLVIRDAGSLDAES